MLQVVNVHPVPLVQENGSPLVLFIVPLFQSAEEVEASCLCGPREAWRHPRCHSVCPTFHLAGGNRTPVLLCVCEDNREPAHRCCLAVRDGSCIQKSASPGAGVNNPPLTRLLNSFWIIINRSVRSSLFCFDDA